MTDAERDRLLLEVAQRTAWIKGKLEEVHLRTAEIPQVSQRQEQLTVEVKVIGLAVIGLIAVHAPEVAAAIYRYFL